MSYSLFTADTRYRPPMPLLSVCLPLLTILFLLSALTSSLLAIEEADDIQLPDIVILGEAEKLPDTISLDQLLQKYWSLEELSEFQYKPFISFEPMKQYQPKSSRQKIGSLSLYHSNDFADYFLADFQGVIQLPNNLLHNYSAALKYDSLARKRNIINGKLMWNPTLPSDTKTTPALIVALHYNSFEDKNIANNEIKHIGAGLNFAPNKKLSIFDNLIISLYFNNYQQSRDSEDEDISDLDIIASLSIPFAASTKGDSLKAPNSFETYIPIELVSVRNKHAAITGFLFDKLGHFNDIGLKILADEKRVYPVPTFDLNYQPNNSFSAHLRNKPFIEHLRRNEILADNPDQNIKIENRLTKTFVNLTGGIHSSLVVPIAFDYNLRWSDDYHYYQAEGEIDAEADTTLTGADATRYEKFIMKDTKLLEHNFNLSAAYHFKELKIKLATGHSITDKEVPFKPDWQYSMRLDWTRTKVSAASELTYLTGRHLDIDNKEMEDAMLLNFCCSYRIRQDLTAYADVINILDSNYIKYQFEDDTIPAARVTLKAGLRWSF